MSDPTIADFLIQPLWFFWTYGETEGVANSFLGKMHPESLLDKDLITHQVCL
jgi:hypothetical protein